MSRETRSESGNRSPPVIEAEIPAGDFALERTFEAVPGVSFRCEPVVANGGQTGDPFVWTYGADRDVLDRAFADDPSVEEASVLAGDDSLLYSVGWGEQAYLVFQVLTNSHATVLRAAGVDGTWTFRLLYPDRDALSRTHDFCDRHGIEFDIRSIREMDGEYAGRYGLTTDQYEALTAARERGYFRVPRGIELHGLAEDLDISHQALSERLRRARDALVRGALLSEPPE